MTPDFRTADTLLEEERRRGRGFRIPMDRHNQPPGEPPTRRDTTINNRGKCPYHKEYDEEAKLANFCKVSKKHFDEGKREKVVTCDGGSWEGYTIFKKVRDGEIDYP